jgi:hypothetical protein
MERDEKYGVCKESGIDASPICRRMASVLLALRLSLYSEAMVPRIRRPEGLQTRLSYRPLPLVGLYGSEIGFAIGL